MSKHHQASRRRIYGRRQHEIHERSERPDRFLGWVEVDLGRAAGESAPQDLRRSAAAGEWLVARGMD
jgi:predicted TIM-barrel fold metal-dependent hydrolase